MVSFFVDPFLLACPSPERGEEDFDAFVHGVIMLQAMRAWSGARVFSSVLMPDRLFAEGRYPLGDDLDRSLAAFGRDQIQARDVIEVVNSILQRVPSLEAHLGVDAILYDEFSVEPATDIDGRSVGFRNAFRDLLVDIALLDTIEQPVTAENITLTRGIPGCPRKIRQKAVVMELEGKVSLEVPFVVQGASFLSQHVNEIHSCINPEQVWIESPSGVGQMHALESFIWVEALARGLDHSKILSWRFGHAFLQTASDCGFLHEPTKVRMLLRACAETILQQNLADTHPLRTGDGGGDPQVLRGNDKAWRRDIDWEFHLHYWTVGAEIELASVVVHKDNSIPL